MFVCAECGVTRPEPGYCGVDGSALHPRGDDPLLGTTIGPYRVARLMGIGGMGRVYRGVHPTIGSRVAIKILSRESSDRPDLVERFFAEAKAVNLIRHEAIVNVLDLARLPDGRPYIVMEHLEGSSLAAIVDEARRSGRMLPLGGLARLVVEVLEGLGAAHAKGIVHRDLKPDNIFVTPQGRAKILDFGIAKLQPDLAGPSPSNPTQTGSLLGTPHYMSPEQAAGRPVDTRSDLYSLGVILFELCTSQRPFSPPALFDLLRMHIEAPPPAARSLRAAIPESLEQVIQIALAKTPEQRFGSAQAMSAALQRATAQLPGDQWEPIVGGRKSQPNLQPVAWAPTPPASWAGAYGSGAPDTERQSTPPLVDREIVSPSPGPQPTTQTAGQVGNVAPPDRRSKTVLFGLVGLALAGGGIAVGVLASKTDRAVPAGSGSDVRTSATPGSAVAGAAGEVAPASVSGPALPNASSAEEMSPEHAALMDQVVADMLAAMSAEQRAASFPPEMLAALKKYGAWSKIPAAERMKYLERVSTALGVTTGMPTAMQQASDALAGIGTPDPPPAKPSVQRGDTSDARDASGWIKPNFALRYPGHYDPKYVDVHMLLDWTRAEAQKLYSDAKLTQMFANNVNGSAQANVTAPGKLVSFRFVVPSRPAGQCAFLIVIDKDGASIVRDVIVKDCKKEPLIGKPKCGALGVLARAKQHGFANTDLVELILMTAGKAMWSIHRVGESAAGATLIPDDCSNTVD